jgi:hypothetical protein
MDDDKPLTLWRALRSAEFWLLLVGCIAAMARLSVWVVVPLLVAGLSISSLPKYIALWPRARAVGAERVWWQTVALSVFNNVGASCAAFVFGVAARWLWW